MDSGSQRLHNVRLIGILGALLFGLGACGGAAPPAAASPTSGAVPSAGSGSSAPAASGAGQASRPAATKVTASYGQVSGSNIAFVAAQDGGYFARNGLNVDLQLLPATTSTAGVLSGQIEIGSMGGGEALNAVANGADLAVLTNMAPIVTFKLEAAAMIKTPQDLIGKKVGISRFGSTTDVATRRALKLEGLDPQKDVAYVQLDTVPAIASALLSGAIQGAAMSVPQTIAVERQGFHPLLDLAAMKLPTASSALVVAQRSWLTAHHSEIQAYIDSLVQGTARYKTDRTFGTALVKKMFKLQDQQSVDETYEYWTGVMPSVPYVAASQFDDVIGSLPTLKDKSVDINKLLDNSFLKEADSRLCKEDVCSA